MAYVDYIHCAECDCKLIYDGDCNARDTLDSRHPDGWSLLCPECITTLRAALAAATERAEAEKNRANIAAARLVVARADYGVLLAPARTRLEALLYGEGQDDAPEGLDVLLTAAADEIEHGRELELEATVEHEARRCLEDVERERDAAIARADALAARLAEVEK